MDATKLTDLPLVYQFIAGAGLFFGTAMLGFVGWIWKRVKPTLPDFTGDPTKPVARDAVVLSAAIADSQSISNLAAAIDRLCKHLAEDALDDARRAQRLDERVGDVVSELQHIKAILRDRTLV